MNKLIFLIYTLLPILCFSQVNTSLYSGDNVPHDLMIYDGNGNPINFNDHSNIGGSPFLQYNWTFATILLSTGTVLTDSSVNYSLFNDQLYFKRNGGVYPVNFKVREFSIVKGSDSAHTATYRFRNGYPKTGRNDSSTFYELLYAGSSLQLLKWTHKTVRENYSYGSAYQSEYAAQQEYFVFYPDRKEIVSLGGKLSKNTFKKKLPAYADRVDAYAALHPAGITKDEDWISLFSFLDSPSH